MIIEVFLLSPGSGILLGIGEASAMVIDVFDGGVIRCIGDVCGYFGYEKK